MGRIPAFRTVIATTDGCYPRENSSIISSTTPKLRYTLLFNRPIKSLNRSHMCPPKSSLLNLSPYIIPRKEGRGAKLEFDSGIGQDLAHRFGDRG